MISYAQSFIIIMNLFPEINNCLPSACVKDYVCISCLFGYTCVTKEDTEIVNCEGMFLFKH